MLTDTRRQSPPSRACPHMLTDISHHRGDKAVPEPSAFDPGHRFSPPARLQKNDASISPLIRRPSTRSVWRSYLRVVVSRAAGRSERSSARWHPSLHLLHTRGVGPGAPRTASPCRLVLAATCRVTYVDSVGPLRGGELSWPLNDGQSLRR